MLINTTQSILNIQLYRRLKQGLVIIGIQTSEFNDEKNIDNVKAAVQDFHIKYPFILDNNYVNWNAYGNSYWPRDYLVDNQGLIRYNHIGEWRRRLHINRRDRSN